MTSLGPITTYPDGHWCLLRLPQLEAKYYFFGLELLRTSLFRHCSLFCVVYIVVVFLVTVHLIYIWKILICQQAIFSSIVMGVPNNIGVHPLFFFFDPRVHPLFVFHFSFSLRSNSKGKQFCSKSEALSIFWSLDEKLTIPMSTLRLISFGSVLKDRIQISQIVLVPNVGEKHNPVLTIRYWKFVK